MKQQQTPSMSYTQRGHQKIQARKEANNTTPRRKTPSNPDITAKVRRYLSTTPNKIEGPIESDVKYFNIIQQLNINNVSEETLSQRQKNDNIQRGIQEQTNNKNQAQENDWLSPDVQTVLDSYMEVQSMQLDLIQKSNQKLRDRIEALNLANMSKIHHSLQKQEQYVFDKTEQIYNVQMAIVKLIGQITHKSPTREEKSQQDLLVDTQNRSKINQDTQQIDILKSQNTFLQERLVELQRQIQMLTSSNTGQITMKNKQEDKIPQKRDTDLLSQIKMLQDERQNLNQIIDDQKIQLNKIKNQTSQQICQLEDSNNKFKAQLAKTDEINQQYESLNNDLQHDIEQVKKQLIEQQNNNQKSQEDMKLVQKNHNLVIEDLNQQLQTLREQNNFLNANSHKSWSQMQAEHNQKHLNEIKMLKMENDQLLSTIDMSEQRILQIDNQCNQAQKRLQDLQIENQKIINSKQLEINSLQEEIYTLKQQIQMAKQTQEDQREILIRQNKLQLSELRSQFQTQLKTQIEQLNLQISQLKEQNHEQQSQILELKSKCQSLQSENQKLEQITNLTQSQQHSIDGAQDILNQQLKENTKLNEQIYHLNRQMSKFTETQSQQELEIQRYQKLIGEANLTISQLQQQLQSQSDDEVRVRAVPVQQKNHFHDSTGSQELKMQILKLGSDVDDLQRINRQLLDDLRSEQKQCQVLQTQLDLKNLEYLKSQDDIQQLQLKLQDVKQLDQTVQGGQTQTDKVVVDDQNLILIEHLQDKIITLQKLNTKLQEENQRLQHDISNVKKENEQADIMLTSARRTSFMMMFQQLHLKEDDPQREQNEIRQLKNSITSVDYREEVSEELEHNIQELQHEVKILTEQNANLRIIINQLQNQINQGSSILDDSRKSTHTNRQESELYLKQLEEINHLKKLVTFKEIVILYYKRELKEERHMNKLQNTIENPDAQKNNQKKLIIQQHQQFEEERKILEGENQHLEKQVISLEKMIAAMEEQQKQDQKQINSLKQEVKSRNQEIEILSAERQKKKK